MDVASIGDTAFTGIVFAGIGLDRDGSEGASAGCAPTDSARTGTSITIIYAREKSADDAIEEVAGALAGFGLLD
jgi:hypothetical protein